MLARRSDEQGFRALGRDELSRQLLSELPAGFEIHPTHHYLICHNTSREYAAWCGALFERLYKGFTNYWTRKGMKLDMSCRVAGCGNVSGGPRHGFMCETHQKLSKKAQREAREKWKAAKAA